MPPLDTAAGQRLIPASTTLLQPGSRFFRLADALNFLDQNSYISQLQNQVETLKTQVAALQAQIDDLHVGGVSTPPVGTPTARLGVVITGTSYSLALYAP